MTRSDHRTVVSRSRDISFDKRAPLALEPMAGGRWLPEPLRTRIAPNGPAGPTASADLMGALEGRRDGR